MTKDNPDKRAMALAAELAQLISPITPDYRPNLNALALAVRNLDVITLNLKYFGFELAKRLAEQVPPPAKTPFIRVGLSCKPCTQADIESAWAAHWFAELKIPRLYHRKLWELAYCLQALEEHDMLKPGRRGLGFGCGEEPIASYLASRGVASTITDLSSDAASSAGWRDTQQHLSEASLAYKANLVTSDMFNELVEFRYADMNAIPEELVDYDFCWSICALEHLGSIRNAMKFVENSLETLRPGGLAVHTTEFNFLNDLATIDNWPTVLPQRRHFEELATRLRALGHYVAALDFDVGSNPLDRFIDLPPYPGDPGRPLEKMRGHLENAHLKLAVDGFASTCFGLIVKKSQF